MFINNILLWKKDIALNLYTLIESIFNNNNNALNL